MYLISLPCVGITKEDKNSLHGDDKDEAVILLGSPSSAKNDVYASKLCSLPVC